LKATAAVIGLFLGVGVLLTACEDVEEFEITGPVLEEYLAAQPETPDASSSLRIHGTRLPGGKPLIFLNVISHEHDPPVRRFFSRA
jgi:hypothetical protein